MGKDLKGKELGEGLSQLKDGRYIGRYTDIYGRRKTIYGKTLKEVKDKLSKATYYKGLNSGLGDPKQMTLDDLYEIWFEDKRFTVKETTLSGYESVYKARIQPNLGQIRVVDIDRRLITRFLETEYQELSIGTVKGMRNIISNIMRYGVEMNYLVSNPCVGIKIRKKQSDIEKEMRGKNEKFLTQRQVDSLIDYAERKHNKNLPIFKLILLTGMRVGEAISLRWNDVDFEAKTLSITKTFARCKSQSINYVTYNQTPKSMTSIRKIPLCDDAVELLAKQKKGKYTNNEFVFVSTRGIPFKSESVSASLKETIQRYNQAEKEAAEQENRPPQFLPTVTIHALRHTFATRCFENGVPPRTVQQYLGHSTMNMTMDLYTHVSEEKSMEDIKKINGTI